MTGKIAVALALALLSASTLPSTVSAAPARAEAPADRVDAIVRKAMADRRIPGLQVAVVKDGKIVLARNYGVANLQTPVPVGDDTVFSINSITKSFSGVAAMREVEAGRLDLARPISAYVDDLPEAWRGITVRQLLSHTSGLPDFASGRTLGVDDAAAWTATLGRPVRFKPGERFNYNQTNYALIQMAINRLNGRPDETVLYGDQLRIAGMTSTGSGDSRDVIPGKAAGYSYRYATPAGPGVLRSVYEEFPPLHRSASGMNSTATDMARWMIAVLDGRLLKPANLETMWTAARFNDGETGQWGMGWLVLPRPTHPAVGLTGGSRAAMYLYPEDGVGVVVLTNLSGSTPEDFVDEIAAAWIPGMKLTGVPLLRATLETRGFDKASTVLAGLRRQDPTFKPDEHELNDWGYRLLSNGKPVEALAVLGLVAELYPQSGNAYDSLAEAYAANGDRQRAIVNYRRSLELDPNNANAASRLKALEAG